MVLDYYNLKEQPFGVTPDPRYLFLSRTHREALASLVYGIQSGRGFISLVACPGMGKTTIIRNLLQQLQGSARMAFLCQTLCQPQDIMRAVLRDLGVADDTSDVVRMEEQLNAVLLAEAGAGRKVIVVIDEAQNLDDSALERVRLLSNFETTTDKLMQIVLSGQPQLGEKLAAPRLLQLRQRMSIVARLQPFDREETSLYIAHRLRVAGYDFSNALFTPEAETLIAKHSEGIPRNINNICFSALSLGCVERQKTIEPKVIREVLNDLDFSAEWKRDSSHIGQRRPITWTGTKSANLWASFTWQKRVAAFASVFLLVLILAAKWRVDSGGSPPSNTTSARVTELPPLAATSVESPAAVPAAHPAQPGPQTVSPVLNNNPSDSQQSTSRAVTRPVRRERKRQTTGIDRDQLWQRVKQQNSNAEVELARMYLEGTTVPRNCEQAQVLLQAASRRGNTQASELLNDGSTCAAERGRE